MGPDKRFPWLYDADAELYTPNNVLDGEVIVGGACSAGLLDSDGDGFTDGEELFMGTLPLVACSTTDAAGDEEPDAWPVDNNDDTWSKLDDVLRYIPVFNTLGPLSPAEKRYDLNADDKITLPDVLKFIPFFNQSCAP